MQERVKVETVPVCIRFWDHAQGSGAEIEPVFCEVFGLLGEECEKAYRVITWLADQELDDNAEQVVIMKGDVVEILELAPKRRMRLRRGSLQSAREKQRSPRSAR